MEAFGKFVTQIIVGFALLLCGAWALTVIWGWLIIPTLGWPALTFSMALAILLVKSFIIGLSASDIKLIINDLGNEKWENVIMQWILQGSYIVVSLGLAFVASFII